MARQTVRQYRVRQYLATNHLTGQQAWAYTAAPESPESVANQIGITHGHGPAEPAYLLEGACEIAESACGTECVYPTGSPLGTPLAHVIADPELRAELGVTLTPLHGEA